MYIFVLDEVKYYTMQKQYKKGDSESKVVREAAVQYETEDTILRVASLRPENHLSVSEKMSVVREGITKGDLLSLKEKSGLDYSELARALSVTRATLINKKKSEKFSPSLSEKILDIADLYSFGFEVFGNEESFVQWMDTPIRALSYQKPVSYIDNQFGRQEVRNLIGRIAYGVYS